MQITHESVAEGALGANAAYLAECWRDGRLHLIQIGRIAPDDASRPLARLGYPAALVAAEHNKGQRGSEVRVRLVWRTLASSVWGDTFFVRIQGDEIAVGAIALP